MPKKFVYALTDPRNDSVHYVGLSTSGMMRPQQHWSDVFNRNKGKALRPWFEDLVGSGIRYQIKILECCEDIEYLRCAERSWIARYRQAREPLANITAGGETMSEKGKNIIRAQREAIGHARMRAILEVIGTGPCFMTDAELAAQIGIRERQLRKYLSRLIDYGMLRRQVEHFSMPGVIRKRRTLMPGGDHGISESQECCEVDAESGTDPAEGDFGDAEDL